MTRVRLATYNVLHGMDVTDGVSDPDRLGAAVARLDADVLALQEVDHRQPRSGYADQKALAAAVLGARWSHFEATVLGTPGVRGWRAAAPAGTVDPLDPAGPDGPDTPGGPRGRESGDAAPRYGVAVVSRLPVLRWAVRRFAAAPARLPLLVPGEGRSRVLLVPDEPRAALAAVVQGPHGPLTVVATHLSFVPGFNVRQLRAITRWAETLPQPAFVLGDLNLPGRIPARITGWAPLVSVATYPSRGPRVQLDHVLAHGVGRACVSAGQAWRTDVSDHRPLSVDLDL
jgi:endonuclease/exonuclease/phosphatase family metal-dependent hydrolase